jgi:fibrillarin-like pre-rRNA processing protein
MTPRQISEGIFEINGQIATKNLVKGKKVYSEPLIEINGNEYRLWNPNRSKMGAAIKKGIPQKIIQESRILYLGAAEGTTISHLSDIASKGIIFGVDISERSMRKFLYLCEQRKNLVPVLADASQPNTYKEHMPMFSMDLLIQDVSQKNQAEIFLRNARLFLKSNGYGYLSVKARSISSSESVEKIVQKEIAKLENEFEIISVVSLHPYEKEHAMVYCRKK